MVFSNSQTEQSVQAAAFSTKLLSATLTNLIKWLGAGGEYNALRIHHSPYALALDSNIFPAAHSPAAPRSRLILNAADVEQL